jgi:hypothetical protein
MARLQVADGDGLKMKRVGASIFKKAPGSRQICLWGLGFWREAKSSSSLRSNSLPKKQRESGVEKSFVTTSATQNRHQF